MKIAFLSFAFGEYSIRLASALADEAEVALWLTEWQSAPHLERLSPDVRFTSFAKPRMRQPFKQISTMRRLVRQIREFAPDVLHIQQGYLWFNPVLPLLRSIPLVITVHDPKPHVGDALGWKTPPFVTDFGFRRATRLIAHNEQMKSALIERGVEEARIDVVPTVVRGDGDMRPVASDDGNLVLFFGRLWAYKGLDYLIRAEPKITEALPEVRIAIAGAGEDFTRYREMMVHPDRFLIHNEYVSEEKKTELFERASVVVLPYIDATQSAVIATAYNFGKPVVATTVGGLPAMVEDGVTGYLVPPKDEAALADAIVRIMSDSQLRRKMGDQARRKAQEEYGADNVARVTLDVYRRAIGTK